MSQQNARTYNFLWGLFGGGAFGAAYALVYGWLGGLALGWQLALLGVMLGATTGSFAGLLSGWALDWVVAARFRLPLSDHALEQLHERVDLIVPLVASVVALLVLFAFFLRVDWGLMGVPVAFSAYGLRCSAHRFVETLPTQFKPHIMRRKSHPVLHDAA